MLYELLLPIDMDQVLLHWLRQDASAVSVTVAVAVSVCVCVAVSVIVDKYV